METNKFSSDDYLLEKKFEIMLDTNNKKFKNEFENLKNELESLKGIINRLNVDMQQIRKEIDNNGNSISNHSINNVRSEHIEKELEEVPKEKPKMHPRCGNFTSDDVSVNKFFYFGNKR